MKKKIAFIVNPSSGQDEPILSYVNDTFDKEKFDWEILVTKEKGDGTKLAKQAIKNGVHIVAAYGGDGTVMEVAQGVCGTETPLAVIAGGTANVLAKELAIPTNTVEALKFIASEKYDSTIIDMGQIGNKKFLNRINFGVAADMLKEADNSGKKSLGQLAYGVALIKHMREAKKSLFSLTIDGKKFAAEGVALIVTNAGNIGLPGFSFSPDIKVDDGILDILLIQEADIASVVNLTGSALLKNKPQALQHWKGKKVKVHASPAVTVMNDDETIHTREVSIKVLPKVLKVLVPKK